MVGHTQPLLLTDCRGELRTDSLSIACAFKAFAGQERSHAQGILGGTVVAGSKE